MSDDRKTNTSSQSDMDEFESAKHKIKNQLNKSKEFSVEAQSMKEFKRETKEEKQMKILIEFDNELFANQMKLSNFQN